jgi:hypothetical protein
MPTTGRRDQPSPFEHTHRPDDPWGWAAIIAKVADPTRFRPKATAPDPRSRQ